MVLERPAGFKRQIPRPAEKSACTPLLLSPTMIRRRGAKKKAWQGATPKPPKEDGGDLLGARHPWQAHMTELQYMTIF